MRKSIKLRWGTIRTRMAAREDRGVALVTVIGVMMVMGIVITGVVMAATASVRTTTVTRADVQSKAAAEAGVAYARSVIGATPCSAPGGSIASPAGLPTFDAEIFWSAGGTASELSTPGCPGAGATSVLIRSTGTADAAGIGDSRNNTNTVEALLEAGSSAIPMFNAAIFANNINMNAQFSILGEGADVVSYKATGSGIACKNNTPGVAIEGSVYSLWDIKLDDRCHIKGDVYGNTKLTTQGADIRVEGNLFIQGSADFNSSGFFKVDQDIWVGGHANTNANLTVGGGMKVRNAFNGGNRDHVILGGLSYGTANGLKSSYSHHQDSGIGMPPTVESKIGAPAFPSLRHDDPIWAAWNHVTPASQGWSSCDGTNAHVQITVNTVIDTKNCNQFKPRGKITVTADLVILARNFEIIDNLEIVSGDAAKHSVYFVIPNNKYWETSSGVEYTGGKLEFRPSSWDQDPQVSLMLYSSGSAYMKASAAVNAVVYGQIYAKEIFDMTDRLTLHFNPVNATGSSGGGLDSLELLYQRDLS